MCNINESVMRNISYVIDRIDTCTKDVTTTNNIHEVFSALNQISPYRSLLYMYITFKDAQPEVEDLYTENFSLHQLQSYDTRQCFMQDPVLKHALKSTRASSWDQACKGSMLNHSGETAAIDMYSSLHGVVYAYPGEGEKTRVLMSLGYDSEIYSETYWCTLLECLLPHMYHACQKRKYVACNRELVENLLTVKESSILSYARDGKTTSEISEELYISSNTVKFHFKKIYEKLSVSNRSHAVAKAISLGLITADKNPGMDH